MPPHRRWWRILLLAAFVFLVLHVVFEGARSHMIPGYLVTGYLLLFFYRFPLAQPGLWTATVAVGMLAVAAALGTLLPVFELPKLTGPCPIGTVSWHLLDGAREETQSDQTGGPRELMIQIWYPADQAGPGQPYRTRAETEFKKAHLALVRTHAATGTALSGGQARYPVVIFSPAWTGRRNQNTVQAEELASHGFVVVGIDHPFGSDLTIFPDGRMVRTKLPDIPDFTSAEAFKESIRTAESQLGIRAADVRFVLDELERLDRSDPHGLLTGRLDTSRVGIFGHSFGGAVAAEVCLLDSRIKAGVNLDGLIFGKTLTQRIGKPFMVVSDDGVLPTPAALQASHGWVHRQQTFIVQNVEGLRQATLRGLWLLSEYSRHVAHEFL